MKHIKVSKKMSTISEQCPSSNTSKIRIFPMKKLFPFYIKNLPTSKFLKIANFFLKAARNFLNPDLKSTIKSSTIKRDQISKNVKLSTSNSPLKTQESIFEVTLPAGVKEVVDIIFIGRIFEIILKF